MPAQQTEASEQDLFRVWACDNQVYGPILLDVLKTWIKEGRVLRDTWIYCEKSGEWQRASTIAALTPEFPPGEETVFLAERAERGTGVNPRELRQFQVFAGLPNRELAQFIKLAQLCTADAGELILRRDQPGDAIYFVLSGSVSAQITVGGDAKQLATIRAGEFFGEMAMFTQTARSADIIALEPSRLLRFSAEAFRQLIEKNPAAAAPMLYSLAGLMARRVLHTDAELQREVASGFVWR